jgi:hypothetical protein
LQANAVGALFVVSVASVNLPSSDAAWASSALTLRAVATVIAAAVLYLMSFWNSRSKVAHMRGVVIVPWWLAAGLVTALLWLELASSAVTISWILVAFTLAFIGRHFRNSHFMAQADVLAAVALGRFLAVDQYSYGPLTAGPVHVTWRAVTAILLATIVYLLSRWNREAGFKVPALLTTGLRAAGTAVLMLLAWRELQAPAVVVAWAATAAVLLFSARRFRLGDLLVQANAIGAAAIARVIIVNLPSNAVALPGIASWRALAVPLLCVVLYGLARWNDWTLIADDGGGAPTMPSSNGTSARGERLLRTVPLWCATGLVALLAWYELLPAAVAVAWTIVALVLLELGLRIASRDLLAQSSLLFYGAVVRVFVVNLNIADYGVFGARAYTVAPVVLALLYAYVRLADDGHVVSQRLASSFAWTGVITAAALVRFEVAADLVVVAWGALTLAVVAAASWSGRKVFLHAGLALAFATLVRGGVHNLYERSYFPAPGVFDAWLYLGGAALLLFCSLPFAFRLRSTAPIVENRPAVRIARWIAARPEQALFFIALVMITAVVTSEMRRGMLTLAWAVEGLAVFLVAVAVGERSYRLSGITLLLLCIAKIFLNDFWTLSLPDKALTGIVMGLALIAVSFLYTHKRDTILRYL